MNTGSIAIPVSSQFQTDVTTVTNIANITMSNSKQGTQMILSFASFKLPVMLGSSA